jgi:hypothetical protein
MNHKDCKGTVLADVTSSYKLLANVTMDRDGATLSTSEIHVYNIKETCSELILWCVSCDTLVPLDKVQQSCRNCGISVSLEEAVLPLESGGTWCPTCAERRCDGEKCVSLISVLGNVSIKLT